MPSYNQGEYLEAAILSIVEQDYPNLEFVVMDGGSTDKSVSILEKYTDSITSWSSEKDNGQSDALNKGFNLITGDVVGWLNSDDTYQAGTLQQVADIFADEGINIAMCSEFGLMDAAGAVFEHKTNSFSCLLEYFSVIFGAGIKNSVNRSLNPAQL